MARYAVTGGAGFIGSHLAEALVDKGGNEVVIIDDLSTGKEANLATFRCKVDFHKADIRDYPRLCELFAGADYVFHEAALVSVFDSVDRPEVNHSVNLTGTLNVLQAARLCGVKRVVLASSCAVYGNDPELPKTESMLPRPESPYGMAKIAKEHYARVYSRLYKLPVIALRYFNVFGPRQDPASPYSGVISVFADRIIAGKQPVIYGDGKQTRDFVYVADVVKANLLAMHEGSLKGGEVFNVATGKPTTLLTLLDRVNEAAGASIEAVFEEARRGDIRESLAGISLAQKVLGYEPEFGLKEGLSRLIGGPR